MTIRIIPNPEEHDSTLLLWCAHCGTTIECRISDLQSWPMKGDDVKKYIWCPKCGVGVSDRYQGGISRSQDEAEQYEKHAEETLKTVRKNYADYRSKANAESKELHDENLKLITENALLKAGFPAGESLEFIRLREELDDSNKESALLKERHSALIDKQNRSLGEIVATNCLYEKACRVNEKLTDDNTVLKSTIEDLKSGRGGVDDQIKRGDTFSEIALGYKETAKHFDEKNGLLKVENATMRQKIYQQRRIIDELRLAESMLTEECKGLRSPSRETENLRGNLSRVQDGLAASKEESARLRTQLEQVDSIIGFLERHGYKECPSTETPSPE